MNRSHSFRPTPYTTVRVAPRMSRAGVLAAGTCCLMLPLLAGSAEQLNIKTGLWEITSTTQMSGTPQLPKDVTAKMTPEQRARLESEMKSAAKEAHKSTDRSCITKKDLENPFHGSGENCKQSIVRTTSTTQEVNLVCNGDPKGTGFIRITTPTPETMTGIMDIKMGDGKDALSMKANLTGRWIGTDCGDEAEDSGDDGDEDEGAKKKN
jgi:Protein of unknown function (DUF3617)